jgi:hypothetical protein
MLLTQVWEEFHSRHNFATLSSYHHPWYIEVAIIRTCPYDFSSSGDQQMVNMVQWFSAADVLSALRPPLFPFCFRLSLVVIG